MYHRTLQTQRILQLIADRERTELVKHILNDDLELFEGDLAVLVPEVLFAPLLLVEPQELGGQVLLQQAGNGCN